MHILDIDIYPKFNHPYYANPGLYQQWILDATHQTVIVLQGGHAAGQLPGDLAYALTRLPVRDSHGGILGERVVKYPHLLTVREVYDTYSLAQMTSFAYQQYFSRGLPERLATAGPEPMFMDLFPLTPGQEYTVIPKAEAEAWSAIDGLYAQISGDFLTQAHIRAYEDMIRHCDSFIQTFQAADSFFLADAWFQKGFALHKLRRYAASNEVFAQYLRLFPNGLSAEGARSWMEENSQLLNEPSPYPKTVILFLGSYPQPGSHRPDLEVREIDQQLRLARVRDQFELEQQWAPTPGELSGALLQHEPHIVHFSGQGDAHGIWVEGPDGMPRQVSNAALAELFRVLQGKIQGVVLNYPDSVHQAADLARFVPWVVAMRSGTTEAAATAFSVGFYKGLGAEKSASFAFELAKTHLALEGLQAEMEPVWFGK